MPQSLVVSAHLAPLYAERESGDQKALCRDQQPHKRNRAIGFHRFISIRVTNTLKSPSQSKDV
jgi:hypothetical protein